MSDATKIHGSFSWNELITTDVEGAKTFYSALLGWTMEDNLCGGMAYTMLKTGEQEVGGIMAVPAEAKGMPPMWGSYVTVDDMQHCLKQTETLGGKVIVPPRDIPEIGQFCVIQDPQGAMLNLIQYS
jgi:predicted enzyme related to lactoylglutathione lyase